MGGIGWRQEAEDASASIGIYRRYQLMYLKFSGSAHGADQIRKVIKLCANVCVTGGGGWMRGGGTKGRGQSPGGDNQHAVRIPIYSILAEDHFRIS